MLLRSIDIKARLNRQPVCLSFSPIVVLFDDGHLVTATRLKPVR